VAKAKRPNKRPNGRSLDEIADAAVKTINPPAASRELCLARVLYCIDRLEFLEQQLRPLWNTSPGKRKKEVAHYAEQLRRAKSAIPKQLPEEQKFAANLEFKIRRLDHHCKMISVKRGSRQRSLPRQLSVQMAYELLELDEPCWQQKVTKTVDGPWHKLSGLFYEALIHEYGRDLMDYCLEWYPRRNRTRGLLEPGIQIGIAYPPDG